MSDEKTSPEQPPKPEAQPSAPDIPTGAEAGAQQAQPAEQEIPASQLRDIIVALQQEVENWRDQSLRARAEIDNVRKRLEREKEDMAKYAISKFARDVVTVGDNFQRALSAVPNESLADPAVKSVLDGVTMIEREFLSVLGRHGVQRIDPLGEPFNPHRHQAVMENEDPSVPTGTVIQVFQSGYLVDDRVLRPAMVVVSKGGPAPGKNGGEPPKTSEAPQANGK